MGNKELAALLRAAAERLDSSPPSTPARETKAGKAERETKERLLKKKINRISK